MTGASTISSSRCSSIHRPFRERTSKCIKALHSSQSAALLLPDLAETVEGRTKIANMVRDIMKSLDEDGLRFVSAKRELICPSDPQSTPKRLGEAHSCKEASAEISN